MYTKYKKEEIDQFVGLVAEAHCQGLTRAGSIARAQQVFREEHHHAPSMATVNGWLSIPEYREVLAGCLESRMKAEPVVKVAEVFNPEPEAEKPSGTLELMRAILYAYRTRKEGAIDMICDLCFPEIATLKYTEE